MNVKLAMSVYAAIPALIGAGIMFFYPLTNKKMIKIEEELTARRKSAGDNNEAVSDE